MDHPKGVYFDFIARKHFIHRVIDRRRYYIILNPDNDSNFPYVWLSRLQTDVNIGPTPEEIEFFITRPYNSSRLGSLAPFFPHTSTSTLQPPALTQPAPCRAAVPSPLVNIADIMNPATDMQTQQQADPTNPYLPNYRANLFPYNPNNPFRKRTAKPTTQQTSQQQNTWEESKETASTVSDRSDMAWRFPPGQFCGRYSTMPSEAGSYEWSDLEHPMCQPTDPKLPLPTAFTDKEEDVEPYIDRMAYFIELHPTRFRANTNQVYLFLQGCTGMLGHPWAAGIMRLYLNERHRDVTRPQVATLQQVVMCFRKHFGIVDKERYAQAKFERLQQGSQSVRNYVAAFEQLKLEKSAAHQAPKKEAAAATPTQPVVRVQAYTKLTEAEKDHLIASNGCFYCWQDGHMVENCPNQKRKTEKGDLDELLAWLLALGAEEKAKLKESLKDF
ncbi:unnamed protein product [Peniophora sp. CBMAI 1063]|nr:unnamed protein product [Peniophora sp. CBMAI 1063]